MERNRGNRAIRKHSTAWNDYCGTNVVKGTDKYGPSRNILFLGVARNGTCFRPARNGNVHFGTIAHKERNGTDRTGASLLKGPLRAL